MNKKIVFSDVHYFGVEPLEISLEYNNNTIHLNDNWDFVNCKSRKFSQMITAHNIHRRKVFESGTVEVKSNHGGLYEESLLPMFEIIDRVLYTHGHFLWSRKKIEKWSKKKPCSGNRFFGKITNSLRHRIKKKKLSKKQIKKAHIFAVARDCHTIVFGHTHIDKIYDVTYKGVRIINVPRGRSEIVL